MSKAFQNGTWVGLYHVQITVIFPRRMLVQLAVTVREKISPGQACGDGRLGVENVTISQASRVATWLGPWGLGAKYASLWPISEDEWRGRGMR